MIYKKEEYVQENAESEKFPLKQIEVLTDVETKEERYFGHVTLGVQTPMGVQQFPVSFEVPAASIKEAFEKFEVSAEPKIEETRKSIEQEIQRIRQEASNRIVTPGEVGMGGKGNIVDFNRLK